MNHDRAKLTLRQRLTFLAALLLVTSHFSLAYISETAPFLPLDAFAAGRVSQPFQERALTAWMLRGASRFDSLQFEALLHRMLPALGPAFNQAMLVLFLAAWLSIMASILLTRASLTRLTGDAIFSSWAAFLVPYMGYFTYILNFGPHFLLPYDLPSLCFFCAGLNLVIARQPLVLVPLIALATLNRETAIFLIIFYLLFEPPRGNEARRSRAMWVYAAGMLVTWATMRAIVLHVYAHNPVDGGSRIADLKLWQNVGFLVRPQHWPAFASIFGFTLPIVIAYRRYIEPAFLRRGLFAVALWFVLMLVVGVLIEIRIFGELIGYMSLVLGVMIHRLLGERGKVPLLPPNLNLAKAPEQQ